MRAFVSRHGLEAMTQAVDDDGDLWARFDVAYQPAWVFISAAGDIELVAGALYDDALFARIDAFLGE